MWWGPLIAGIASWACTLWMVRHPERLPLDRPNERSLHLRPVPRLGGVAIMCGLLFAVGCVRPEGLGIVLLCATALSIISVLDDYWQLSARIRFGTHLLAAGSCVVASAPLGTEVWLLFSLVFAVCWSTNLYNFLDGSNGLAGGMAVFGFSSYALLAANAGDSSLATVSGMLAAASLGFLVFNFHPAQIFMGDGGSIPLGFLAGTIGFLGVWRGRWTGFVPPLVFAPFLLDASVTLCRRLLNGEKFWQPHKTHYYQRLIRMGWSHRKTALMEYSVMLGCGLSALLMQAMPESRNQVLGIWSILFTGFALTIDARWHSSQAAAQQPATESPSRTTDLRRAA